MATAAPSARVIASRSSQRLRASSAAGNCSVRSRSMPPVLRVRSAIRPVNHAVPAMETDVETRTDELYALPLERFVPERDLLVKELRADGRREEAAEVAGLAKPSIAAWAVNQVVRTQASAARELWEAGDAILGAQELIVGGTGSGADLRTAIERERAALATLGGAARGLVTGSGRFLGDQNVQAVTETLHAAAVDPGLRTAVARRAGDAAAAGGGPWRRRGRRRRAGPARARAASARPDPAPASPAARRLAERRRGDDDAEAERRQADRARRERLAAAQKALARAEQARDAERRRIAEAAKARDAASDRVEAAMAELGRAEDDLGRAEQALETGHAALEEAEAAVDAARSAVEDV